MGPPFDVPSFIPQISGQAFITGYNKIVEAVLAAGDAAESAAAVNRLMEDLIMQAPEQYLWGYNRYKAPRAEILTSTEARP